MLNKGKHRLTESGWTKEALECLEISADCSRCRIPDLGLSDPCQMRKTILNISKFHGPPKQKDLRKAGIPFFSTV